MQTNVGTIDRVLRIIVGLVLIAYAIPLELGRLDRRDPARDGDHWQLPAL